MTDDITFCVSKCNRTGCYRHPFNMKHHELLHSYADFAGTADCLCHEHLIEVHVVEDCASWWSMVIDLQKVAECAGKRERDTDGTFYTDWSLKQAKRLCKLIAEHGTAEQHEMCHAWFSTNEKLMKAWLNEYNRRK